MLNLTRTIRFCISQDGTLATDAPAENTFAAWPPMRGLGAYYELQVTAQGNVDPNTGYFINIKKIDEVVRLHALPLIPHFLQNPQPAGLGTLMQQMLTNLQPVLNQSVQQIKLKLTPTYAIAIEVNQMSHILISQQFEFSAAHRLHSPQLTDQQNLQTFGKCNNPSGHGHNYKVQVTVRAPITPTGQITPVENLDQLVNQTVIERFDHKHLNHDTKEFANLNSSVENISKVIYDLLKDPITSLNVTLESIKVWETGKTVCTYIG